MGCDLYVILVSLFVFTSELLVNSTLPSIWLMKTFLSYWLKRRRQFYLQKLSKPLYYFTF